MRVLEKQIEILKRLKGERSNEAMSMGFIINRKIAAYRKESKRKDEMSFKDEDWYKKEREEERIVKEESIGLNEDIKRKEKALKALKII